MWEICCNRLAPMRLEPFSYFCTCWKVRPRALPSFSWLIASIIRHMRTRPPTCLSTGLGDFFSTLANLKKCPFLSAAAHRPQKTFSVKAPVAIGHGAQGLAPLRRLWPVGATEAEGPWEPSRANFGTNCRSAPAPAHHLTVPLIAYCLELNFGLPLVPLKS